MVNSKNRWTPEMEAKLKGIFPHYSNKEIVQMTGWNIKAFPRKACYLKLRKTEECLNRSMNRTIWTTEKVEFIKSNFFNMTNQELADAVGVGLTTLRNKTRSLGLKNYELEFWTPEQIQLLQENYQTIGDTVIAEMLNEKYPHIKKWTRKHVKKKRDYMGWHRTKEQVEKIVKEHSMPGGRSDTIIQNSASYNLPDRYVARCIVGKNGTPETVLASPVLLNLKRQQLLLQRTIKKSKNK